MLDNEKAFIRKLALMQKQQFFPLIVVSLFHIFISALKSFFARTKFIRI